MLHALLLWLRPLRPWQLICFVCVCSSIFIPYFFWQYFLIFLNYLRWNSFLRIWQCKFRDKVLLCVSNLAWQQNVPLCLWQWSLLFCLWQWNFPLCLWELNFILSLWELDNLDRELLCVSDGCFACFKAWPCFSGVFPPTCLISALF